MESIDIYTVIIALSAFFTLSTESISDGRILFYISKPLTTLLIIFLAYSIPIISPAYKLSIIVGLIFSLSGDVFLMLRDKFFIAGLVSFFAAHLCYIFAFSQVLSWPLPFWPVVPLGLVGVVVYRIISSGLGSLRFPVIVYILAILTMVWMAMEHFLQNPGRSSIFAFIGAVSFLISDALLAYNRFRNPVPNSNLFVLGTYYLAQWCIALSVG